MSIDFTVLRSTVGRRILLLFVACALLPIGVLTLVSFRSVSRELEEQSAIRLRQLTKTQMMSIVERLDLLDIELQVFLERLPVGFSGDAARALDLDDKVRDRFLTLTLRSGDAALPSAAIWPDDSGFSGLGILDHDGPTLVLQVTPGAPARVFLSRSIDPAEQPGDTLWAEINPLFLWWGPQLENNLPPASELCVVDTTRTAVLFCNELSDTLQVLLTKSQADHGELAWSRDGTEFLASYRTANLRANFGIAGFTLVLSQERDYLLSPLADFKRSFPPIILASLGLVLLLSIGQIRKQLVPLERLQSGTRRIAARDFSTRVEIDSGDEFEQLAGDFNSMADRLGKQFGALRSMNEIVQAVLSALDREEIVRSILANFEHLLQCEALSVTLLSDSSPTSARAYLQGSKSDDGVKTAVVEPTDRDLQLLHDNPQLLILDSASGLPTHLQHLDPTPTGSVAVFPIFVDHRVAGMISASFLPGAAPEEEDLGRARQLADQVAVAFSNVALLSRLEQLSRSTLTALARSIDAKSHWTAGHSERVANTAVVLGREMGLSAGDLDILHRGSLLHDIGKIGVPSTILDKPGRLTKAEMEVVRGHAQIGARILEPIAQLGNLLPLVLQHHEWFNGEGYPEGLAGEQINLLARILAVVDIYDALRSPRPYRDALDHETVIRMITEGAGTQLDPQVVGAFLKSQAWRSGNVSVSA